MANNADPMMNHPLAQPNPHRVILGPQPYPGPSSIVSALLSTAAQSPAQRDLLALYASGLNSPLNPLESPQAYMNTPNSTASPLAAAGPLAALLGGSNNTSAQSNLSSLASQVGAQSCQPLPIMEVSAAGLTALALHSVVVVTTAVPPVRVITTLDEHVTLITALAWSHHVLNLESDRSSVLQLASGDLQGNIIVWNVAQPHTQLTRFTGSELKLGAVLDVQWMRARHARHLLAAVHYPNHLVLYNTLAGSVVWRIELPDPIISLHLNPFDAQQACLATPHGGIFVVKDFKLDAAPRQVELKYKINSQGSDATLKSDYVQMCFSPHHRHIVFFLLEKRILVFDLSLNQSVAVMMLDRTKPPLKQLCLSQQSPNLLFCLHEENLITAWKRRESSDHYQFELCASLDLTRHNKTAKKKSSLIYSMALTPLSDRYIYVTSSDGSVMAVEWRDEDEGVMRTSVLSAPFDLYAPQFSAQSVSVKRGKCELRVVSVLDSGMTALTQLSVAQQPSHHCRINTIGVHLNTGMLAAGLDNGLLLVYGPSDFVPRHTFQLFTPSTVTAAGASDALANNVSVRGVRWLDEHHVISFSSTCVDKGLYVNRIVMSDIRTGQHTDIRKKTDPENTYIRGIRPSPAKSYLIVLLKDQPFQIWSLKTYTLLRTLKPYVQITAIEWAPSTATPAPADKTAALDLLAAHSLTAYSTPPVTAFDSHVLEQFVFASPDGSLKSFKVDSSVVTAAPLSVETGPSNNVSSALAMKERYLVTGDTLGTIHVHNLDTPGKSSTYQTNKGVIRRIKFSPASTQHQIVVLFNDGEFGVWDIDRNTRVSLSTALRQRNLRAVDVDWLSEHQLVIATSDGCMRVMDKNMTTTNSALTWHTTRDRLALSSRDQLSRGRVQSPLIARVNQPLPTQPSPLLLSVDQAMRLKTALLHGTAHLTAELRALVDAELVLALDALHGPSQPLISDTAARALLVARYFGNLDEIRFLTLVLYFMEKVLLNKEYYSALDRSREESEATEMQHPHWSLPECYDLLRDNEDLKRTHLFLAHLHTKKRNVSAPYEMTKKMGDHLLLLGEKDKAIELLLETNPQHPQYYQNLLKSCLIAASQSAEHLKNTVKLVSSQLIAEGWIDEGVQLLSLMPADPLVPVPSPQLQASKGVRDAARYLQSYDRWTDAAWLVKLHYPSHAPHCREVLVRWAHYLFTVQQYQLALELYLSLGMFTHALQVLHKAELYDLAALLVRACEETGLDKLLGESTSNESDGHSVAALQQSVAQISLHDTQTQIEPSAAPAPNTTSSNSNPERSVPFAQLKEMIYVEYGYHLKRFGCTELGRQYWQQGGAAGQEKLATESM